MPREKGRALVAQNKRARHEYSIEERFEAGIALQGWEVKALRAGRVSLTEGYAMLPTAAVSGFYFSHPDSRYFGVGKIGRDQVQSYAARRGVSVEQAERDLAPNLGYSA